MTNYQGTLLSLSWTKICTSRQINSSLFTQTLKWSLSTSSDFTAIRVYNKWDPSIYNHFSTLLYKIHDSQKCFFQIFNLSSQINIYSSYIFSFHFLFFKKPNFKNSSWILKLIFEWTNYMIFISLIKNIHCEYYTICISIIWAHKGTCSFWSSYIFNSLNCIYHGN